MEEFYNTAIYNTTNTLKEGPMLEVQFILAALGIFGSMLVLVLVAVDDPWPLGDYSSRHD